MEPEQFITLAVNFGAFGVFAFLFWKRLVKVTDAFAEKMETLQIQHRAEMKELINRYHKDSEELVKILIRLEQQGKIKIGPSKS